MKRLFFLLLFLSPFILAQGIKLGVRLEPGYIYAKDGNQSDDFVAVFNFSTTIIVEPTDAIGLEIQPGILIGTDQFTGIEIGSILRYNIPNSDISALFGMNHHFNASISSSNFGGSQSGYFPFYGVGIGYTINPNLRFDLSYFVTSRKEYSGYDVIDYITGERTHFDRIIEGIVRLGLNMAFEIVSFK